jgi:SAP domain-containing ribonucleoprotein
MGKKRNDETPLSDKPIKVKGIDTTTGEVPGLQEQYDVDTSITFKEPETKSEALLKKASRGLGGTGRSDLVGSTGFTGQSLEEAGRPFALIDMRDAIPDAGEREALKVFGAPMEQRILDPNKFGVLFEKDIEDLQKFYEKNYHKAVKNFVDDLDESQSFIQEMQNIGTRFLGNTGLNIAGVIPLVYGVGSAIINGDKSKVFDNELFDAWEFASDAINVSTTVFGGSDVWNIDSQTGEYERKPFHARFMSDPIKSMSDDIVPAVSFVAGAVGTELAAAALAPVTGGLSVAGNTARLTAQADRIFRKGYRYIRGLDQLSDSRQAAQLRALTATYRKGYGTAMSAIRSSGYESALIARSTQERTYAKLIENHRLHNLDAEGNPIDPTPQELERFKRLAADAGESAFMLNVPLVAGANMFQMPKLFLRNYKSAKVGVGKTKSWGLEGQKLINGKWVSNAETKKYLQYLGYTKAVLKGPISEGWEEFAQGAIEEGLMDYYATNHSAQAAKDKISFLHAMTKAGKAYWNTTEGKDSITIGALMGLVGLRLPVALDAKGRAKFDPRALMPFTSTGGYGGSFQNFREVRDKVRTAKETADFLNENSLDQALADNFENHITHLSLSGAMDTAAKAGNTNAYKNSEHDLLFKGVYTRHKQGVADTVLQEIDALEQMSLEEFNKQYAPRDSVREQRGGELALPSIGEFAIEEHQYTEETKAEAVKKAKQRVQNMLDGIATVEALANDQAVAVDWIGRKINNMLSKKKKAPIAPNHLYRAFKEQLAYLYSASNNAKERQLSLENQLKDLNVEGLSYQNLSEITARVADPAFKAEEGSEANADFKSTTQETINMILKEWKESDPVGFNLQKQRVVPLLYDLAGLKVREARASALYAKMFTKKGAEDFTEFAQFLAELEAREMREFLQKLQEKDAKNIKNASVQTAARNEESVTGKSDITDGIINKDTEEGLKALKLLNDAVDNNDLDVSEWKNETLKLLDKHPGLFLLTKRRLDNKGQNVLGIKSVADLQAQDENGELIGAFLEELAYLEEEYNEYKKIAAEQNKYTDPHDGKQPRRQGSSAKRVTPDNPELDKMFSTEQTTNLGTTLLTHDKDVKNRNYTKDGKPTANPILERDKEYADKIDNNKLNSPEFLSNKQLMDNIETAEFILSDEAYESDSDIEDIVINVYHSESGTFLGQLPAYKEGNPGWLYELRQAVVDRYEAKDDTTGTEVLKSQIDELKSKLDRVIELRKERAQKVDEIADLKELQQTQPLDAQVTTDYSSLKVADLKALLKERELPVSGKKAELIERLIEHDKTQQELTKEGRDTVDEYQEKINSLEKDIEIIDTVLNNSDTKAINKELIEKRKEYREGIKEPEITVPSSTQKSVFKELNLRMSKLGKRNREEREGALIEDLKKEFGAEAVRRAQMINEHFEHIVNEIDKNKEDYPIFKSKDGDFMECS